MASLYDPINYDLKSFQWEFILCPDLWEKFNTNGINVDYSKWTHAKMMDSSGNLNDETKKIPNCCGGIYVYAVVPPVMPECGSYIMYVGKATKTRTENLRARVRSYKYTFSDPIKRPKLYKLFHWLGQYVYVYYLPMDATIEDIKEMEDRLIATFGLPPCNVEIQIDTVKAAVKAFR
jgi:hypothetical protein